MGWTSYQATHYKGGRIDRKAECMDVASYGGEKVVKASMKGSVFYAAVRSSRNPDRVYGLVILTQVDNGCFCYKDMTEDMGPGYCDCPKSVLDALTPTTSQYAKEWRRSCYENVQKQRDSVNLSKLPIGTVIQVVTPFDLEWPSFKLPKGSTVQLRLVCTGFTSKRTQKRWVLLDSTTGYKTAYGLRQSIIKDVDPTQLMVIKTGEEKR